MSTATSAFTSIPMSAPANVAKGKGFFARFVAAVCASREAAARREIARHMRFIEEVSGRASVKAEKGDLPF